MQEAVINEILLVCSALGTEENVVTKHGDMVTRFVRGEQCLEWLQDLQRFLFLVFLFSSSSSLCY